jgi:hypothetical protein
MAPLAISTNWAAPVAIAVLWNCFTKFLLCVLVRPFLCRDAERWHARLDGGEFIVVAANRDDNSQNHQRST